MSARVRWHARWVVPVASPPIEHGCVITEAERIVWVGERAHAPAGGQDQELGDAFLTPGLVNTHTHLGLTMMRGLLGGLSFFNWVRTLTAASATLSDSENLDAAMLGLAEGIAAGTTTFADTAPNEAAFNAMRQLGVRGIAYREVFGPDPKVAEKHLALLADQLDSMTQRATDLVQVGVSPHAPYSVSDDLFAAVARLASERRLPVAVHIAESADEQRLVTEGEGDYANFLRGRGIEVLPRGSEPMAIIERAQLLRRDTLLIHAVRLSEGVIPRIAGAGCGVAHCPASNAWFGHGVAPLAAMTKAGVQVGLGSDSMASNDRMDILEEARLAALAQRSSSGRPDLITAKQAFRLATLGGAEALNLDEQIGSLEVGKQADIAAFAMSPQHGPVTDPYAALVFGPRPATKRVLVAGEELFRDGIVQGFDLAISDRVQATAEKLQRWRREQPSV
jgi:5-methylthioadenosine/S-adenosylhomocysteine deaminase